MRRPRFKRTIDSTENIGLKQLHREVEIDRRYDMIMPIDPRYNPIMCRDQFLHNLFLELDLPMDDKSSSLSTIDSLLSVFSLASRYDDDMSVNTFLQQAHQIIRTTRLMDRPTVEDGRLTAFKFSVMTGRTDRYDELLESMKRSALYFMFSRVINRMRVMDNISQSWGKINLSSLPHMIFSWSMDAFFKRCTMGDPVYLDVLQLNYSDEWLDWAKFTSDIQEIIRFYKFFYKQTYLELGHKNVLANVTDQQMLFKIGESLGATLQKTKVDYSIIFNSFRKVTEAWWGQQRRRLVMDCKKRVIKSTLILPIQWRYIRDYYATITEMQKMKDSMAAENIRNQIKRLKEHMEEDDRSANTAMLAYVLIIEKYQARIAEFSNKLSFESSCLDEENQIIVMRTHKADAEYKEIEEKISYMRKRIREVKREIRAERQLQISRLFNLKTSHSGSSSVRSSKQLSSRRSTRHSGRISAIRTSDKGQEPDRVSIKA